MGDKDLINELFEITKNFDSIVIIDFIPDDKIEEFNNNFSKILGYGISIGKPDLLPWKTIEYSSSVHRLGKDKGIPKGFLDIQLIVARHLSAIGEEIICNCKIDKEEFDKLFDEYYEEYIRREIRSRLLAQIKYGVVDVPKAKEEIEEALNKIDLKEKYNFEKGLIFNFKALSQFLKETTVIITPTELQNNYFNARLEFIKKLQNKIEEFFQNLIPGIYLSKKEKCLSVWIYDISNSDLEIVKKARNNSLSLNYVYNWRNKFEYKTFIPYSGEEIKYHGTNLSLIGWTGIDETYEFISLLGQNFIISYGWEYKENHLLGNYKYNFIMLKLKEDPKIETLTSLNTESALINLSKFLFPTEWIKHLYPKVLELDQEGEFELEDMNLNNLASELEKQMELYEKENIRIKNRISSLLEISKDLRCLESLISSNTYFLKEVKDRNFKTLSEYLKEESNSWMTKIREEIKNISKKQSLEIQYLHDTINTLNSFVSLKYQKDIKRLTWVLVGLTLILVYLTIKKF